MKEYFTFDQLLQSYGLQIHEKKLIERKTNHEAPSISIVSAGIAYLCDDEEFTNHFMRYCRSGRATYTLSYQWKIEEKYDWLHRKTSQSRCVSNFLKSLSKNCHLHLTELIIEDTKKVTAVPTSLHSVVNLARAYHHSLVFNPLAHAVVRVRFDSIWCIPKSPPLQQQYFVSNIVVRRPGFFISDWFAMMSKIVANMYFNAWIYYKLTKSNNMRDCGFASLSCRIQYDVCSPEGLFSRALCELAQKNDTTWLKSRTKLVSRYNASHFANRGSGFKRNQVWGPETPSYFIKTSKCYAFRNA